MSDLYNFPINSIKGVAGEFVDLYSSYLEVPKSFLAMTFLGCLGNTLSKRLTLGSEIKPEPRLYILLLGESADERKSTALIKTTELFKYSFDKFDVCSGIGSAEGLQRKLKQNNRLILCFDEFNQFVAKCSIESSVLLPCVNTLFESTSYESNTKKYTLNLQDVHLSFLAASTTQTYAKICEIFQLLFDLR